MKKVLVTIIGRDRPGIVHKIGKILADYNCNILEVSQTTLLGEFAGLFSTDMPNSVSMEEFTEALSKILEGTGLAYWVKSFSSPQKDDLADFEPYVITLRGPDQKGIVPEFAGAIAAFEVNIDNLRAVALSDSGKNSEAPVVLVFEVSVPQKVHQNAFRQALSLKAEELQMEVSVQHRDIFEAIHRL